MSPERASHLPGNIADLFDNSSERN